MRRKGHPSFPSAMTCCFFSSLKTLLMLTEAIGPLVRVNVPGLSLAGFQVTLIGRFWVTTEGFKTHLNPCEPKRIHSASQVLQKAKIDCRDFEIAVAKAQKGDLVYLDPPY